MHFQLISHGLPFFQLISELNITGGDEKKVGYYAGLIVRTHLPDPIDQTKFILQESLFFATEAMTVLQWSRMSDHVGRKPVLMIGLFGTMLSMLFFGLSRSFSALVIRYAMSI